VDAAPRGRLVFGLTLGALAWSLALIAGALLVPVYDSTAKSTVAPGVVVQSGATLIALNGTGVLVAVAVPTAITLLVWAALHRRRTRASRLAGRLAAAAVAVLAAFNLIAMFTIGIFMIPATLMLAGAVAASRPVDASRPVGAAP
jgi:hypothetical protein